MVLFVSFNMQLDLVPLWASIEGSAKVLIVELLALGEIMKGKLAQGLGVKSRVLPRREFRNGGT